MKPLCRLVLAGIVAVNLSACAARSKSDGDTGGLQKIQVRFADFETQQDTVSRAQPVITVTPVLEFTNPNDVPVTLVKLDLELRGDPALVQIDRNNWPIGKTIAPGSTISERINIFATLRGVSGSTMQLSPLYVSGRAYFKWERGTFSQGFVQQQHVGDQ
jgi:hypothetical protein